jgi:hypothetical protein
VAVWLKLPLVPLTVSVKVPLGPEDNVLTVSVVVVAETGVNLTVEPEGWPVRLSVTDPVKPLIGAVVTV